ncbi:hypothetical protein PR048_022680 [Dryococelus australis]|uniref:DDE Tnp4 domain-containing protein n=1 Tax=Dryococelus australis TaxID=614101 RepID=A0ABQ9GS07_9NEOP|nr:hypothetical protein PR048_022680 [Dryococelus australis]
MADAVAFAEAVGQYADNPQRELKFENGIGFRNFLRMTMSDFEELLQLVSPLICRNENKFRRAVSPQIRLAGDSFTSLQYTFKISQHLISYMPIVFDAIMSSLKSYTKVISLFYILHIQTDLEQQVVFSPIISGDCGMRQILNNKLYSVPSSVVIVTDLEQQVVFSPIISGDCGMRQILNVHMRMRRRLTDGKVLSFTSFYDDLVKERLKLPASEPLPGREKPVPYVIVVDDAFTRRENIMKPYKSQYPGSMNPMRILNYRLSRAQRIVENVFGILPSKFRTLHTTIALHPDKIQSVNGYTRPGNMDYEDLETGNVIFGTWRKELNENVGVFQLRRVPRKPSSNAECVRDEFREYYLYLRKVKFPGSCNVGNTALHTDGGVMSADTHHAVCRHSSYSLQTLIIQSADLTMQSADTHHAVYRHSSYSLQTLIIQSADTHHAVCRHSSYSLQTLIIQSADTHHTVCRHSSYSLQTLIIQSADTHHAVCGHSPCSLQTLIIQSADTHHTVCGHSPCSLRTLTMQSADIHLAVCGHSPCSLRTLIIQSADTHHTVCGHSSYSLQTLTMQSAYSLYTFGKQCADNCLFVCRQLYPTVPNLCTRLCNGPVSYWLLRGELQLAGQPYGEQVTRRSLANAIPTCR